MGSASEAFPEISCKGAYVRAFAAFYADESLWKSQMAVVRHVDSGGGF